MKVGAPVTIDKGDSQRSSTARIPSLAAAGLKVLKDL
jgi:hypothetical protein